MSKKCVYIEDEGICIVKYDSMKTYKIWPWNIFIVMLKCLSKMFKCRYLRQLGINVSNVYPRCIQNDRFIHLKIWQIKQLRKLETSDLWNIYLDKKGTYFFYISFFFFQDVCWGITLVSRINVHVRLYNFDQTSTLYAHIWACTFIYFWDFYGFFCQIFRPYMDFFWQKLGLLSGNLFEVELIHSKSK